jgi:hypothetical protein
VRSLADIVSDDDVFRNSEYMHMTQLVAVAVPKYTVPDPEAMGMELKGLNTKRSPKKWRSRDIACIAE